MFLDNILLSYIVEKALAVSFMTHEYATGTERWQEECHYEARYVFFWGGKNGKIFYICSTELS